jgi:hypothetical protein
LSKVAVMGADTEKVRLVVVPITVVSAAPPKVAAIWNVEVPFVAIT